MEEVACCDSSGEKKPAEKTWATYFKGNRSSKGPRIRRVYSWDGVAREDSSVIPKKRRSTGGPPYIVGIL